MAARRALSSPNGLAFVLKDSLLEFSRWLIEFLATATRARRGEGGSAGEGRGADVKGSLLHQHHPQVTKELFREMRSKEVFVSKRGGEKNRIL